MKCSLNRFEDKWAFLNLESWSGSNEKTKGISVKCALERFEDNWILSLVSSQTTARRPNNINVFINPHKTPNFYTVRLVCSFAIVSLVSLIKQWPFNIKFIQLKKQCNHMLHNSSLNQYSERERERDAQIPNMNLSSKYEYVYTCKIQYELTQWTSESAYSVCKPMRGSDSGRGAEIWIVRISLLAAGAGSWIWLLDIPCSTAWASSWIWPPCRSYICGALANLRHVCLAKTL